MNDAHSIHPVLKLAECIGRREPVVVAPVVEVSGASPAKVRAQIILQCDGAA